MKAFRYAQLVQSIGEKLDAGMWQEGDKLPSIRALAAQYGVSKITVQTALHHLEAQDRIEAKPRSGFVVKHAHIDKRHNPASQTSKTKQPRQATVPSLFHDIMARSAAFDIYPSGKVAPLSTHLQLLNRHIGRAYRQQGERKSLYYSPPEGLASLREQISLHYRQHNIAIGSDEVCVTSGCQNSLYLALSTVTQPGDIVAVESPGFYGVLHLLQALNLKVIEVHASLQTGINVNALEQAIEKHKIKACVVSSNFATPSGACMPSHAKARIAALAAQHNIAVIEDDIYGDLGFHFRPMPIKHYDSRGHVILCSSVSKSVSRDLRLGWICGGRWHDKIVRHKLAQQLASPIAVQEGLSTFMSQGDYRRHLSIYRKQLRQQRDDLLSVVASAWPANLDITRPEGGLAVWVSLADDIDTMQAYQTLLQKNIVLTPGHLFSHYTHFNHCVRLSFVHPIDTQRRRALVDAGEYFKDASRK
ncbi:PLP-dependent aminotransferase family protein [Aestuariibacter sp. AA17]|uniref:PLP-dependent aminotransferase family protein n=1 Tax=Fluctibacter corallii TaxID=2984329 RepID=A0ABT3A853_9ALTE|nr:PLP-dependent aminotransferase family protein [Aestuariibacter sp. AA17]MCV2884853.1 PLP-dependent aminotransferase family protein [Aestuariibacter sp. AA17]